MKDVLAFMELRPIVYLTAILLLIACSKGKSEQSKRLAIAGRWGLAQIEECRQRNVNSDRLLLYENGTFEQHTLFNDGERYDSTGNRWEYLGNNKVRLHSWLDVIRLNPEPKSKVEDSAVLDVDV